MRALSSVPNHNNRPPVKTTDTVDILFASLANSALLSVRKATPEPGFDEDLGVGWPGLNRRRLPLPRLN